MERFYVEKTKGTPEVCFDPDNKIISLKGQSYPENAFKFYEPVFNWIDKYLENGTEEVNVILNLPYINTSSSKCIMMLLEKLDESYKAGGNITVKWYYDAENESELECAEEFKDDLSLPFEIIAISD